MKKYYYFKSFDVEGYSLFRLSQGFKDRKKYELYTAEDMWFKYIFDIEDENLEPITANEALLLVQSINEKPIKADKKEEIILDRNVLIDECIHVSFYKNFGSSVRLWFDKLRSHNTPFNDYINNLDEETSRKLSKILEYPNFDNAKEIISIIKRYNSPFLSGKLKIIKHIPHASLEMPEYNDLVFKHDSRYNSMDSFEFNKYNFKMSDIGVDRLFKDIEGEEIIPKYSRLYCDVEKYLDDSKEEMSKYGMGVIYSRLYDNKRVKLLDNNEKDEIYKYYNEYHKNFRDKVNKYLSEGYNVLILDLHSFSQEQAQKFSDGEYPDICIGINENCKDDTVANYVIQKIIKRKYSYKLNYPYSGSIVPLGIDEEKAKGKLVSIMLEVNKKIYL